MNRTPTASLPRIAVVATGGTIAGAGTAPGDAASAAYRSAVVSADELLAAVPGLRRLAALQAEQLFQIDSADFTDDKLLALARHVAALCARDDVDAVVITHGTDTMEETAYFLNLTVKSDKPVVLVGAMRPSTAMSADGPMNLYNAVVTASDPASKGRGVMVAMNDTVLDARDVTKTNTTGVQTFASPNFGPLGYLHNGKIDYQRSPARQHTSKTPFDVSKLDKLPQVGIVYSYANASDLPAKALVDAKFDGIVSAGVGNGNLYHTLFDTLAKASKDGIRVVRSARVPTGSTTLDAEIDDAKYGFVAAETLNPQKARVLLMLALTQSKDPAQIQRWFQQF